MAENLKLIFHNSWRFCEIQMSVTINKVLLKHNCYGKVTKDGKIDRQALGRCRNSPLFQQQCCWLRGSVNKAEQNLFC